MADDCSAGFAILPLIMIIFFIAILSRALRGSGGGYYGGRSSYRAGRNPGLFMAMQYLDGRSTGYGGGYGSYYGSQPSYSQPAYSPYGTSGQMYQQAPGPGYAQGMGPAAPAYGTPGYAAYQPQQPAYGSGQPAYQTPAYASGQQAFPPPAYQAGQPAYQQQYYSQPAQAPAYSSYPQQTMAPPPAPMPPPAPEMPKVPCSYCGTMNPSMEPHCLLCGAPIK